MCLGKSSLDETSEFIIRRYGNLALPSVKVRIEDSCTACGFCADVCPDVFKMAPDRAEVENATRTPCCPSQLPKSGSKGIRSTR